MTIRDVSKKHTMKLATNHNKIEPLRIEQLRITHEMATNHNKI